MLQEGLAGDNQRFALFPSDAKGGRVRVVFEWLDCYERFRLVEEESDKMLLFQAEHFHRVAIYAQASISPNRDCRPVRSLRLSEFF